MDGNYVDAKNLKGVGKALLKRVPDSWMEKKIDQRACDHLEANCENREKKKKKKKKKTGRGVDVLFTQKRAGNNSLLNSHVSS